MIIDGIDFSIVKTMEDLQDSSDSIDKQISEVKMELTKNHSIAIHKGYQKIYDRLIKHRAKCRDLKLRIILKK